MYNPLMAASYTRVQSSMKAQVRSKKASVKATNNTSIIEDLHAVITSARFAPSQPSKVCPQLLPVKSRSR
jgi:hypothetical protein